MLKAILVAAGLLVVSIHGTASAAGGEGGTTGGSATFPRLMGMNIGVKNYESAAYQAAMARLDVVILGFYRGCRTGTLQRRPWRCARSSKGSRRSIRRFSSGSTPF